jgi:hypothetical protein
VLIDVLSDHLLSLLLLRCNGTIRSEIWWTGGGLDARIIATVWSIISAKDRGNRIHILWLSHTRGLRVRDPTSWDLRILREIVALQLQEISA